MKSIPRIKIGEYEIKYIQVLYDDRYLLFKHRTSLNFVREIKISHSDSQLWHPLIQGIMEIQRLKYKENIKYLMNLNKRINRFYDNIKRRDDYLDRD